MKEKLFSITKSDFEFQTFKSSGKGGQHGDKTDSGVRIIHKETGLKAESEKTRSQYNNKIDAFKKLTKSEKFKKYLDLRIAKESRDYVSVEDKVNETMKEENLKIEIKNDKGRWVES